MLDDLREILTREKITTAAIVDDVYDELPLSQDINQGSWDVFVDDVSNGDDEAIIRGGYIDPEGRWDELRHDENFIKFLWEHRSESEIFKKLFDTYETDRTAGQVRLEPLRVLLFDDLKLKGTTYGSHQMDAPIEAQLLFIDLFLGTQQNQDARDKAMQRVKDVIAPRREEPPMVVLMSSSTRLEQMRDEFRDEAELVGSQFRVMPKSMLDDPPEVHDLLSRLTASYQDSLKVNGFLYLWQEALREATNRFLKTVRRLDLRDYADLQMLVLNAEDESLGTYLLEVFGKYFHFEIEEDASLAAEAVKLNEMTWDTYPAPHFLPAADSERIADGLLFRSAKVLSRSAPLEFGDVLFSTRVDALGEGVEPSANFAKGERIALLVLNAACDLKHDKVKRILFLAGVARPSKLQRHTRPDMLLTPVLIHDGMTYVVEWDPGAPVAWTLNDVAQQLNLEAPSFERVRRLRTVFSLQLQQRFASDLSRVGTPAMPPMQHVTAARISYRDRSGHLHDLISIEPENRQAILLVGWEKKGDYVERLMLDLDVVSKLRNEMQKVDANMIDGSLKARWEGAVEKRELFAKMQEGIPYSRTTQKRSFPETEYDVVTVIGPHLKQPNPIDANRTIANRGMGPLIIELMPDDVQSFAAEPISTPDAEV
jgi:hypothetical protein